MFRTIDLLYTFLLFWPTAVIPKLALVTLLQFFIPVNLVLRSQMGIQHNRIHKVAAILIALAVIVSLYGISLTEPDKYSLYSGLVFLTSGVMLAVSHCLKEVVVRRQPLDMTNFNFKISIAQLISLIFFTPLILHCCKSFERFTNPQII